MSRTDLAVLTALPLELEPITAAWGVGRPELFRVYRGTVAGRPVAAMCSGSGTVAGALGADHLMATVSPSFVLMGGIAGGITRGTPESGTGGASNGEAAADDDRPPCSLGDLVIADAVGFYDVDLTALGIAPGAPTRHVPAELVPPTIFNPMLLQRYLSERGFPGAVLSGTILSGNSFLNRRLYGELPRSWRRRIASARAVEMEGAAWVTVAERHRIPWAVVRYISDLVDSGESMPFPAACRESGNTLRDLMRFFLSDMPRCC